MKYITALLIIFAMFITSQSAVFADWSEPDRWLYYLEEGQQVVFVDDNGLMRQLTFVDALPSGFGMACRINESDYSIDSNEYGAPTRHGYRPTLQQNFFEEMNWTIDTYFIYHGGYYAEEDGAPWIGCYAMGDQPFLLVFSRSPFTKFIVDIRNR